jgi:hypothetical protein
VARYGFGQDGTSGSQPYLVNNITGQSRPIAYSVEHSVESMRWSPDGSLLAIARIHRWQADGITPSSDVYREAFVYNPETGESTPVATGASKPQWAP